MASLAKPSSDAVTNKPPRPRRWIPLSLRMFVAMIVILSVGSVLWIVVPAYRQYVATREIERVGGFVDSQPVGPAWLRGLVGEKWMERTLDDIEIALLDETHATDETLRLMCGLPRLREIWLQHTRVTDSGLVYLHALTELETLYLDGTQLTDDGLLNVKGLKSLKTLHLGDTKVTDAGLKHLRGLTNLESLWLDNTPVTDSGAAELKRARPGLVVGM